MIGKVLTKVFGSQHERDIKRLQPTVDAINQLEDTYAALDDEQLKAKTEEFRRRLSDGETLDDLLHEAFAVVREASKRTLGMRHYDVQLIGGVVLHQGKIAEMKTGEGKTLMATLPVYLNALAGRGVHVVTVNDYLARRDAEWMGVVYEFLGMTVGVIQHGLSDQQRHDAYRCDVTYGTNNELGFDYLRDNMKFRLETMVQRQHSFAIVDEVDSILIDEARTPLIISGPSEQSTEKYYDIDRIIPKLERGEEIQDGDSKYTTGDFLVDEKANSVALTDDGVTKVERLIGIKNLYDAENIEILHGVNQGLRAHHLFKRDVDYMVKDGQIVIVDEFTGRMMPGRRWSDGLHQAVEAKEGVKIERESQTLATITFQNYFRMYDKLAGMTGTADTEASEFGQIYKLDVVVIPTNRPMARDDRPDLVYRTAREKWDAVVEEIADCVERGQPTLVGTISIEKSEMLSKLLKRARIPHVVLNAKYHQKEAQIVAQAGRRSAVTIATNMAGRGTDIVLGGNAEQMAHAEADPEQDAEAYAAALAKYKQQCRAERQEVLAAGGLHILGTERHESRRIDNQLRGRSGRQGDPGSSRFFLSLEDDLMRIFMGTDRIQGLMRRLGMEDGVPIEANMVSRAIERAQKQVEGRNFEIRKHLLEYDDVMNKQREAIYRLRRDILDGTEGREYVLGVARDVIGYLVDGTCDRKVDPSEWQLDDLEHEFKAYFDVDLSEAGIDLRTLGRDALHDDLVQVMERRFSEQEEKNGSETFAGLARHIMLSSVDAAWKDHLLSLDHLKEGVNLRGYAQKDPKNEYKRESYELFQAMKDRVEDSILKTLFRVQPMTSEQLAELERRRRRPAAADQMRLSQPAAAAAPGGPEAIGGPAAIPGAPPPSPGPPPRPGKPQTVVRQAPKVGRNDPCPCGSGKKYKRCHGMAAKRA
ncbi:MAG: preprotein translocase subunit SecA [Acidobacteria bacterium]|nr:MAG: preprotein translocase subunit SecA [Acidobacteriota bacterium]REK00272.1 MAG: preprotein translocase subunit SecA [Acidobacteriota bacterium]